LGIFSRKLRPERFGKRDLSIKIVRVLNRKVLACRRAWSKAFKKKSSNPGDI